MKISNKRARRPCSMENTNIVEVDNPNAWKPENTEAVNINVPSDEDSLLIVELLKNGVSLARVCELFCNRVDEKCIRKLARNIISTISSSEENDTLSGNNSRSLTARFASMTRLGTEILNCSISATRDSSFIKAHAINLVKEAPEELLDPLFFTLMNDPVVVSSGYVFNRDTVLDSNGNLRITFCPFTRAPLKKDVYPLICRKRMLKDYQECTLGNMIKVAQRLLEERCFEDFGELMSIAERFINDLGESVYERLSVQLAKVSLEAHTIQDSCSSILPKDLAEIYIRIYSGSPFSKKIPPSKTAKDCSFTEELSNDELVDFKLFESRINEMIQKVNKAIKDNEIEKASAWLDACEMVQQCCLSINLPTAKLKLSLAKAKGEDDLFPFQRLVYDEIRSNPEEVSRFCAEEGVSEEDLTKLLKPVALLVEKLYDNTDGDEWRCALRSNALESRVSSVRVHAGMFKDQDWGNQKANLGLALYDTDGELVTRCNLFGTYRSDGYTYGDNPSRVLLMNDEIVSMARPGFKYALEYTVGGSGGHYLKVTALYCKIFPSGYLPSQQFIQSCSMRDPEGDEGLYTGQGDRNGKAHGLGELVYYDRYIFVGKFYHGSLKDGVLYKENKIPFYTMKDGSWSGYNAILENSILDRFPYDVSFQSAEV